MATGRPDLLANGAPPAPRPSSRELHRIRFPPAPAPPCAALPCPAQARPLEQPASQPANNRPRAACACAADDASSSYPAPARLLGASRALLPAHPRTQRAAAARPAAAASCRRRVGGGGVPRREEAARTLPSTGPLAQAPHVCLPICVDLRPMACSYRVRRPKAVESGVPQTWLAGFGMAGGNVAAFAVIILAALLNGSFAAVSKIPIVRRANVHPIVFNFYVSIGVLLGSYLSLIGLHDNKDFVDSDSGRGLLLRTGPAQFLREQSG
eukprot:scaffold1594_cov401-Prasinococcus_capsulatus_cf.AAC.49